MLCTHGMLLRSFLENWAPSKFFNLKSTMFQSHPESKIREVAVTKSAPRAATSLWNVTQKAVLSPSWRGNEKMASPSTLTSQTTYQVKRKIHAHLSRQPTDLEHIYIKHSGHMLCLGDERISLANALSFLSFFPFTTVEEEKKTFLLLTLPLFALQFLMWRVPFLTCTKSLGWTWELICALLLMAFHQQSAKESNLM